MSDNQIKERTWTDRLRSFFNKSINLRTLSEESSREERRLAGLAALPDLAVSAQLLLFFTGWSCWWSLLLVLGVSSSRCYCSLLMLVGGAAGRPSLLVVLASAAGSFHRSFFCCFLPEKRRNEEDEMEKKGGEGCWPVGAAA
uniref:Uncharacterized protein n=1 Tax=Solanum tuberosum TaxID=4113 RepID=M1DCS8_SOLTU